MKTAPPPAGFHASNQNVSKGNSIGDARHAMATAYGHAHESKARSDLNKMLNDAQRVVRGASVFKAATDRPMRDLENAIASTVEGKRVTDAALEDRVSYKNENLASISEATEMRGYLRSLPAAERDMVLQRASNEMDLRTLRAIAAAPAVLSGLSHEMRAHARETFLSLVAPEQLAKSKELGGQIASARHFADQMRQAIQDSVDWQSAAEIEKLSA